MYRSCFAFLPLVLIACGSQPEPTSNEILRASVRSRGDGTVVGQIIVSSEVRCPTARTFGFLLDTGPGGVSDPAFSNIDVNLKWSAACDGDALVANSGQVRLTSAETGSELFFEMPAGVLPDEFEWIGFTHEGETLDRLPRGSDSAFFSVRDQLL